VEKTFAFCFFVHTANIHFSILSKLTVLICVIISEPLEDAVDPPVAMETEPSAPASQAGAAYSK